MLGSLSCCTKRGADGETMARWQFKEKTPTSVKVVMLLFFAVLAVNLAAWWSIPEWSPRVPDAVHSVPIRFKGGVIYFVQPWLAKTARDANWLAIGLGAAGFVLFWLHRDELERLR
jgi:hypothetical protein